MARLIWIGVGAVGGVYAYRKGEQVVETVRQQGVAGTAQLVAAAALQSLTSVRTEQDVASPLVQPGLRVGRFRISRAEDATPAPSLRPAAIMDTGVIDITDAGRPRADTPRRRKAR